MANTFRNSLSKAFGALVLLALLSAVSGCAASNGGLPKAAPETALNRFASLTGLNPNEIPRMYNPETLSVGARVTFVGTTRILGTGGSDRTVTFRFTRHLRHLDRATDRFVIERYDGFYIQTDETHSAGLAQLLIAGSPRLIEYQYKPDHRWQADDIARGGMEGGLVGAGAAVMRQHGQRTRQDEASQRLVTAMKRQAVERSDPQRFGTKVLSVKRVGDQVITVRGTSLQCVLYEIRSIIKAEMLTLDENQPRYPSVRESQARVWVSDLVPFGLVRTESTDVHYLDEHQKPIQRFVTSQIQDYADRP